jgi:lysozyme family protein
MNSEAMEIIERVIVEDEGGWKLTHHSSDTGGWTFGGMTFATFSKWMRLRNNFVLKEETFVRHCTNPTREQEIDIMKCYYDCFFVYVEWLPDNFQQMAFSCAIVLGLDDLALILQRMINSYTYEYKIPLKEDGILGTKTKNEFEKLWEEALDDELFDSFVDEWVRAFIRKCKHNPAQIANLEGWFNRAIKYRK